MGTESYSVSDSLFLVRQPVAAKARSAQPAEIPTNHVAVIDCSGSMAYDLPRIREQLKRRLPKLLGEQDTISIVWFSGRGQFGTLIEGEPVSTLTDLQEVERAIDRWLRPVCLTGFKEPLEEVGRLVDRLGKKRPGSAFALFFMSDGCDNQWSRSEILRAMEQASGGLSQTTIVEYGYYADRPMLAAMAERAGGSLIFAEDFDRYSPAFEAAVQKRPTGAKRKTILIKGDPIGGFAFAMQNGELTTYAVDGCKVTVPEDLTEVFYLSPSQVGAKGGVPEASLYAAISLYSVRMMPDVVYALLRDTGDVALIDQFAGCFGKQKYSEFMEAAHAAAFDESLRLAKGYDPNKVPREDAFTVLDVLSLLAADPEARLLLDHRAFKYSRIGRGRIDADEVLTADEQAKVAELTEQMHATRDPKKVRALAAEINAITNKPEALKFVADPAPDGYPISDLVLNESRPNISVRVLKPGSVDLSARLPKQFKGKKVGKIPEKFSTQVWRNYTIVKDGLINVQRLPIRASDSSISRLAGEGAIEGRPLGGEAVINLARLPVVNRQMVKGASARALFELELQLCDARAAQKVYNSVLKERYPADTKRSETLAALYGDEGAQWLKEQGINDYGFAPKSVQADATDYYMARELKVSLKGLSSLPSLKDVRERMKSGKLTPSAELMARHVERVDSMAEKFVDDDAFKGWLESVAKIATLQCRDLMFEIARIKFAVIVGQVWFSEFKSLDDNSLTLAFDGRDVECRVEMKETKVSI